MGTLDTLVSEGVVRSADDLSDAERRVLDDLSDAEVKVLVDLRQRLATTAGEQRSADGGGSPAAGLESGGGPSANIIV